MLEKINGLYFAIDEGTELLSCASGIITQIQQSSEQIITDHRIAHTTNLVTILTTDGTYARYLHIDAYLKEGDKITTGQPIGKLNYQYKQYAPHLHLDFFADEKKEIMKNVSFTPPVIE
jgi:murein DD-endopeptidase MepM/ murein hydrolase activator NlpD